jgi:uncharacterized protein (TIGR00297 family)
MLVSYAKNKLTFAGSISGGIISILVFYGAGLTGFIMMSAFFIMATWATSYRKKQKKQGALEHQQKRNALQVWANAGIAGLAGALSIFIFNTSIFHVIIGCVFASAAADTISSELGTVTGKKFFNILSLKPDQKGLDGVISMEGTSWGLAASLVIGLIYYAGIGSLPHAIIVIIAGTIGNLTDSVLGALLERKGRLNNDAVNVINTIIAAMAGWWMTGLLG